MVPVGYWATSRSAIPDNGKTMNLISSAVYLRSPEMICSELGLILYRKITLRLKRVNRSSYSEEIYLYGIPSVSGGCFDSWNAYKYDGFWVLIFCEI